MTTNASTRTYFICEDGIMTQISEDDLRTLLDASKPSSKKKPNLQSLGELSNLLQVNQRQWDIAIFLQDNPHATAEEVQQHFDASIATVNRDLRKLKEAGFLERIGSRKTGHWNIKFNA